MIKTTTYYLEMTCPTELKAKEKPDGIDIVEATIKDFRLNRFLYQLVGEPWQWFDKLSLPDNEWAQYSESDNLRTWVAYSKGSIAGYYELQKQENSMVEIVYFGLSPKFMDCGFGGFLLSHAIASAWSWGDTQRVWLHTCTLDHPHALKNYESRGFQLYKVDTHE